MRFEPSSKLGTGFLRGSWPGREPENDLLGKINFAFGVGICE
eukprot:CAMPEP_0119079622 /NCGR_PEP_ID=MMETSP1178-20130426/108124_1 /TAXON_ID=33656 /ORGANISM="unid sp, Strain CCMP2000" /LENGTH=41 /DNA_ID= /DNA_START= /DNA_END= /DNA_ORIENTATION=